MNSYLVDAIVSCQIVWMCWEMSKQVNSYFILIDWEFQASFFLFAKWAVFMQQYNYLQLYLYNWITKQVIHF